MPKHNPNDTVLVSHDLTRVAGMIESARLRALVQSRPELLERAGHVSLLATSPPISPDDMANLRMLLCGPSEYDLPESQFVAARCPETEQSVLALLSHSCN